MKYEQEVVKRFGSTSTVPDGAFEVIVLEPHLDPDLTTIAIDTPDGRRHETEHDDVLALAQMLEMAHAEFPATLAAMASDDEEE